MNKFENREGLNLKRRKLTIISQTPDVIIADIERADYPTIEGTPITAEVLNAWDEQVNGAVQTAQNALTTAQSANTTSGDALQTAQGASSTAVSANSNSLTAMETAASAVTTANNAMTKALDVESQLADRGASVFVGEENKTTINFTADPQSQIDAKVNKAQGIENADKIMATGTDGIVALTNIVPLGNGITCYSELAEDGAPQFIIEFADTASDTILDAEEA